MVVVYLAMAKKWNCNFVRFNNAGSRLLAAFAGCCFARIYPPQILIPFSATGNYLSSYKSVFESAPSFFNTIAIGLVIGVCVSSQSSAEFHCLTWISVPLFFELSQTPVIAQSVSSGISIIFIDSISTLFGPYWSRGVFEPLDMLATLMGGGIAMYLIIYLPLEKTNERNK